MRNIQTTTKLFYQAWNERDFELLDEIIHPLYHPNWVLMEEDGPDIIRREIRYLTSCIPDLKYEIVKMSQDEDMMWVWYRMTGTHKGNFFGFDATGKTFSYDGASIIYVDDEGMVVDRMGFYCFEEIFRQLGLVPPYWELHQHITDYTPKE